MSLIILFSLLVALPLGGRSGFEIKWKVAHAEDPVGVWVPTTDMWNYRGWHVGALMPDGRVLIAGGYNGSYLSSAELWDPATGKWTFTDSMKYARRGHRAVQLPDGRLVVTGGRYFEQFYRYVKSTEIYDPVTETWSESGDMHEMRHYHTMTLMPDGRILAVGGYWRDMPGNFTHLNSAELFDPATGKWTLTGSMAYQRNSHTATLLPNGKVLIVGGWGSGYPKDAELYDPATGTFTKTGALNEARDSHTASLLPDGKVLIAGGYSFAQNDELTTVEIYDPETGKFTPGNPMHDRRELHTATTLLDGRILVAGGNSLNTAEIYNPATGEWTVIDAMDDRREQHLAILLPDGRVMVSGGHWDDRDDNPMGDDFTLYGVEIYTPEYENLPPIAKADSYEAEEDTPLNVSAEDGVLANDLELNGEPLAAALDTPPAKGTVVIDPDGSFVYTPDHNAYGEDEFTYQVCDNQDPAGCSTGQVTIDVSPAPDAPAAKNDAYEAVEETPLEVEAPGVLANDEEVDGEELSAAIHTQPKHGAATMSEDGSFVYTPEEDFFGEDEFVYKVCDNADPQGCSTAKVVLDVANTQDPPVAEPDEYTATENKPLVIPVNVGLLANDGDVDGDVLYAVLEIGPEHGTVTINANGSFVYTPEAGYLGPDTFTYRVYDEADPDGGDIAVVMITVTEQTEFFIFIPAVVSVH